MMWAKIIIERWNSNSPLLFKWITRIASALAAVSLAIHLAVVTGGGIEPNWWLNVYPYLIGIPAGMAAVAKITKDDKTR